MQRRIALLVIFSACRPVPTATDAGAFPAGPAELPTTDGAIAITNFESQLRGFEALTAPDLAMLTKLAGLRLVRARFFGTPSDYDRARSFADRAVAEHPDDPHAVLLRARTSAALHRFAEAEAELTEAARRGVEAPVIADVRASILEGRGRLKEALAELDRARVGPEEDGDALARRAAILGELGDTIAAERTFRLGVARLRDVSPFPLAGLYFQAGLMWEREGDLERARTFYRAAHERLPASPPITAHLAATSPISEAIRLLRPIARGEDPEYKAQLATLLYLVATSSAGAAREAARLEAEAASGYDALMAAHPEAFADHAARFWLGRDPKKALAAARQNLAARGSGAARVLVLDAALAASDGPAACEFVAGEFEGVRRKDLSELIERARALCAKGHGL